MMDNGNGISVISPKAGWPALHVGVPRRAAYLDLGERRRRRRTMRWSAACPPPARPAPEPSSRATTSTERGVGSTAAGRRWPAPAHPQQRLRKFVGVEDIPAHRLARLLDLQRLGDRAAGQAERRCVSSTRLSPLPRAGGPVRRRRACRAPARWRCRRPVSHRRAWASAAPANGRPGSSAAGSGVGMLRAGTPASDPCPGRSTLRAREDTRRHGYGCALLVSQRH